MKRIRNTRYGTQRGFTLLLAALVSSIVLAVGAAIFGIAQKQVLLSALGRDSQFAFYAADTAAECALYWDFRFGYYGTSLPPDFNLQNLKCDGQCLNKDSSGQCLDVEGRPNSDTYPYTMTSRQFNLFQDVTVSGSGNLCAQVSVTKCQGTFTTNGDCVVGAETDPVRTIIHSDGYNTNCESILTSTRALQRSVELHY